MLRPLQAGSGTYLCKRGLIKRCQSKLSLGCIETTAYIRESISLHDLIQGPTFAELSQLKAPHQVAEQSSTVPKNNPTTNSITLRHRVTRSWHPPSWSTDQIAR